MMAATSEENDPAPKKGLDFTRGDVVYLKGDSIQMAGAGIILHVEKNTCDIHDVKDSGVKELNFDIPFRIPMIHVYWVKSRRKMWMEDYELYLFEKKGL